MSHFSSGDSESRLYKRHSGKTASSERSWLAPAALGPSSQGKARVLLMQYNYSMARQLHLDVEVHCKRYSRKHGKGTSRRAGIISLLRSPLHAGGLSYKHASEIANCLAHSCRHYRFGHTVADCLPISYQQPYLYEIDTKCKNGICQCRRYYHLRMLDFDLVRTTNFPNGQNQPFPTSWLCGIGSCGAMSSSCTCR